MSLKLSSLVPADYAEIEARSRRSNAAADVGAAVAMEEQAVWLARKIRELWLENDGEGDGPEEQEQEQQAEAENSCSRLTFDLARLLDDDSRAEGLHPLGTLAWKRDKLINTLRLFSARIHNPTQPGKAAIHDASAKNKSLDMLQRLERIQGSGEKSTAKFCSSSVAQQEEEDEARKSFFLKKASVKEKEAADAEAAEAKRQFELENEIRAAEVASRAPPPTTTRLRVANASSISALQDIIGSSKGKALRNIRGGASNDSDISGSLSKFREDTLGVK